MNSSPIRNAAGSEKSASLQRLSTMNRTPKKIREASFRRGINRIEVIVVLSVIVVLAALLIPAIQQAREAAHRSSCKNNLKVFGLGLYNYHEPWNAFPYGCVGNASLPPEKRWSWYTFFGVYWGAVPDPIIDLDRAWDDPSTRPLLAGGVKDSGEPEYFSLLAYPTLNCPSAVPRVASDGQPFTDYVGLSGLGNNGPMKPRTSPLAGAWAYEMATKLNDVNDGVSHTLWMMETAKNNGCWLAGGPATVRSFDPDGFPAIRTKGQFGGIHPGGGGIALFMDGEVRMLSDDIDATVFSAYATITGKERTD